MDAVGPAEVAACRGLRCARWRLQAAARAGIAALSARAGSAPHADDRVRRTLRAHICRVRPVVREVADKFLACGVLRHGFARVPCDAWAAPVPTPAPRARTDGAFVPWPAHDTAALTEAFRRAVLRLFVRGASRQLLRTL